MVDQRWINECFRDADCCMRIDNFRQCCMPRFGRWNDLPCCACWEGHRTCTIFFGTLPISHASWRRPIRSCCARIANWHAIQSGVEWSRGLIDICCKSALPCTPHCKNPLDQQRYSMTHAPTAAPRNSISQNWRVNYNFCSQPQLAECNLSSTPATWMFTEVACQHPRLAALAKANLQVSQRGQQALMTLWRKAQPTSSVVCEAPTCCAQV